ncbi:MAG: GntR family transcriptional regulator [Coriobacteriia bacterium]|nr:GntR family transcriptional regulator [Coriobacteriia bacterium]
MLNIDRHSRKPSYQQVIDGISQLIASGALGADEKLPSVRSLALDLSINPNTIQKAYAALDASGVTYSVMGIGSFVAPGAAERIKAGDAAQLDALAAVLHDLALARVDKAAVHQIVEEVWADAQKSEQAQTSQKGGEQQ